MSEQPAPHVDPTKTLAWLSPAFPQSLNAVETVILARLEVIARQNQDLSQRMMKMEAKLDKYVPEGIYLRVHHMISILSYQYALDLTRSF